MRKLRTLIAVTAFVTIGGTLAIAAPAYANTIFVSPGQSIQAAVDAANPGDEIVVLPGTYHEMVEITTDGITLTTLAPNKHNTILLPPSSGENFCTQSDAEGRAKPVRGGFLPSIGICVHGSFGLRGEVTPVDGVSVSGFAVKGFSELGVVGLGTTNFSVDDVLAVNDGEYGITSFVTSGTTFTDNEASLNEVGLYIGDSPFANFRGLRNRSHDNTLGILIRNASHGRLRGNTFTGNCAGILQDAGDPGPVRFWKIDKNRADHNDGECPNAPIHLSGAGIIVGGGQRSSFTNNETNDNGSGGSGLSGGIVVGSLNGFAPNHDLIQQNVALNNTPFDILWDGTGVDVQFVANACDTSQPVGIC